MRNGLPKFAIFSVFRACGDLLWDTMDGFRCFLRHPRQNLERRPLFLRSPHGLILNPGLLASSIGAGIKYRQEFDRWVVQRDKQKDLLIKASSTIWSTLEPSIFQQYSDDKYTYNPNQLWADLKSQ
jgi:hypothetical protein